MKKVSLVLSVSLAAVGGALASTVVTHLLTPPERVPRENAVLHWGDLASAAERDEVKFAALEGRIEAVEARRPQEGLGQNGDQQQLSKSVPVDAHSSHTQKSETDQALRQRYDDERSDPSWSTAAASTLRSVLTDTASRAHFAIDRVDCHTTMCVADVHWPSYEEALPEFRQLMQGMPCATEITLPPPSENVGRYQARMMIDCEQWRTQKP